MNVSTIVVSQDTAIRKVADLKALTKSQRTEEDDALLSLYSSVAKHGARVITLSAAFKQAGLNELAQPRLAIAPADWQKVNFARNHNLTSGEFFRMKEGRYSWQASEAGKIRLAPNVFPVPIGTFNRRRLTTQVPYIPAAIRPKFHLRNYHVLFEVEKWTFEMPVDPFLLKHIMGETYAVIAEWELTELEASLVGGMRN